MKQNKSVTAVEWLEEEINQQQKSYIDLAKKDKSLKKGVDAILTATTLLKMKCKKAKEIEKQQKGYSKEEVDGLVGMLQKCEEYFLLKTDSKSDERADAIGEVLKQFKNK